MPLTVETKLPFDLVSALLLILYFYILFILYKVSLCMEAYNSINSRHTVHDITFKQVCITHASQPKVSRFQRSRLGAC